MDVCKPELLNSSHEMAWACIPPRSSAEVVRLLRQCNINKVHSRFDVGVYQVLCEELGSLRQEVQFSSMFASKHGLRSTTTLILALDEKHDSALLAALVSACGWHLPCARRIVTFCRKLWLLGPTSYCAMSEDMVHTLQQLRYDGLRVLEVILDNEGELLSDRHQALLDELCVLLQYLGGDEQEEDDM